MYNHVLSSLATINTFNLFKSTLPYFSFLCSSPLHIVDTELFTQYDVMVKLLTYLVVNHPV